MKLLALSKLVNIAKTRAVVDNESLQLSGLGD